MYTSILGNKQSTIHSYMYFFLFPFSHTKRFGETQTQQFCHHQISALFQIFPSLDSRLSLFANQQRTDSSAKPERNRKKTKCGPLALLVFHSSYRTNSLFWLYNTERSLKVVKFHIRTSAGRIRLQSAGGIWSTVATQQPRSHHASHQDLQQNNTKRTPSHRSAVHSSVEISALLHYEVNVNM